jgi:hypothetical protein
MGPPLPGACKGQAQAVFGTSIIGVGGAEPHRRASDTVWRLDTTTMRYELLPKAPFTVNYPQGVAMGQDFYVFGGDMRDAKRKPGEKVPLPRNLMYRLSRDSGEWRWKDMPSLRVGRSFSGAAAVGTTIYVIGGEVGRAKQTEAVEAFDTAAPEKGWTDLPSLPAQGRAAMAVAAVGKNIYVFGGEHSGKDRLVMHGDAYVLGTDTKSWRRLPDSPFMVDNCEAAVYKDRYIILAGGIKTGPNGKMAPLFEVVVFDTVKEMYRVLPTRIPPHQVHPDRYVIWVADAMRKEMRLGGMDPAVGTYRNGAELSLVGNKVYLCGGEVVSPEFNVTTEVLVGTIVEAAPSAE